MLFAQEEFDTLKSEDKFDLFFYEIFLGVDKLEDKVNIFALSKNYYWQLTGGPQESEQYLFERITTRVNLEKLIKVDSAEINVELEDEMRRFLDEQYFNNVKVITVKQIGDQLKVETWGGLFSE